MRYVMIFPALCLLAACAAATGSSGSYGVHLIDAKQAKLCKHIGDTSATSPFYGVFSAPAVNAARYAALEHAAQMGGNAVLWHQVESNSASTIITGDVYRCAG